MPAFDQESNCLTIAATGDALMTRQISGLQDKSFLQVLEVLQGADIAFTNLNPTLAKGPVAEKILQNLSNLSAPLGAIITQVDGVGLVDLTAMAKLCIATSL